MSLIDLILQQKAIPLTLGLALLLIMAALTLMIVPRIRKHRVQVARQRAERKRLAAEAEAVYDEPEPVQVLPGTNKSAAPRAGAATPVQPAAAVAKPTSAPVLAASPQQAVSQSQESETTPSAMQDILSSVFSDEENSERQAALMRGLTDVDIANLLTLTQQVVVQLHGGKTVMVVSERELE
jgi:hypothetical protein